jgi:hypothetical protein
VKTNLLVRFVVLLVAITSVSCKEAPINALTFDFSARAEAEGQVSRSSGRAFVAGPYARIELNDGAGKGASIRTILITRDTGDSFEVLQPDSKTYYEADADMLRGKGSAKLDMLLSKGMRVSNFHSAVIDDGSQSRILDYPTRRYTHRVSFDLSMEANGVALETSNVLRARVWTTDALSEENAAAMRKIEPRIGIAQIDEKLQQDLTKIKGFPLKQVVESTVTVQGQERRWRMTTNVGSIKREPLPLSIFERPDEYKKVDPPRVPTLPGLPGSGS